MHRKWKALQSDEIYAVWKGYLKSEGLDGHDPLRYDPITSKPIRLTPMEIIKLVEELIDRLEIKEEEDGKEMDSGCHKASRCFKEKPRCQKGRKDTNIRVKGSGA